MNGLPKGGQAFSLTYFFFTFYLFIFQKFNLFKYVFIALFVNLEHAAILPSSIFIDSFWWNSQNSWWSACGHFSSESHHIWIASISFFFLFFFVIQLFVCFWDLFFAKINSGLKPVIYHFIEDPIGNCSKKTVLRRSSKTFFFFLSYTHG